MIAPPPAAEWKCAGRWVAASNLEPTWEKLPTVGYDYLRIPPKGYLPKSSENDRVTTKLSVNYTNSWSTILHISWVCLKKQSAPGESSFFLFLYIFMCVYRYPYIRSMVYWPSIFAGIELCSHPEHVQNDGSQQLYVSICNYVCTRRCVCMYILFR